MTFRPSAAIALAFMATACGDDSDSTTAPRPCSLITEAELETFTMGPLEPLREELNDCRTNSPESVDASDSVFFTLTVHSFESRDGSSAFYESVVAQTATMEVRSAAERARCGVSPPIAGGRSVDAFALTGTRVLQVSLIHPTGTCDMAVSAIGAALGRL